ncbi:MAG: tetratricopeptide repeat protein, partial [Caldilineaceae bacterium]|nr:tetratricopeptide repeat protein [Caldilineaceae bacterium]
MAEEPTSARKVEPAQTGDQIRVGEIRDAKNIAIGKEIQQTIYEGYTAAEVALLIAEARKGEVAAAAITIPPPPAPTKPPEISNFVGRDRELTHFIDLLESAHLAVIAGMAGVGKTALAATLVTLVAREPSRIFWHSLHEGEGLDGVLWGLASFLAWHGKDELWKLLQSARLTGGQPPPTETLFDYLLQLVRDGNYLLCFDDFHHVDDDPVLNQLVERLRQALVAGQLSIVITARRVPEFVTLAQVEPVQGLSDRDAQRLLRAQGVALTPEQTAQLYTLTRGNAEFLILASAALKNARDPADLLEQLAASDDIERYLVNEVDDALTGQERTVMNALAVLLGYAATRDAIEAVVDRGNLLRTLRGLAERHLLVVQETGAGRAYRQHDLVREFYYEMNSRRDRRKLHARAGEYYRDEEPDLLLAGIHYARAGEPAEAARLATQDLWGIVNRGQIRPLRTLLEQVADEGMVTDLAIAVNLAKGQIYTMQAEGDRAAASLQAALTQIDSVADETQQRILAARACRNMGELLEERAPREALTWLEQGLARLQRADQLEEAALHIRSGTIYLFLNQYETAMEFSHRGIALLPETPTQWRSIALRDLSGIHNYLGEFEKSIGFATQSINICQQLSDPVNQIIPTMNLAVALFSAGNTQAGLLGFNEALALAIQTGNVHIQAQIEQNLGTAKVMLGMLDEAQLHLQKSLDLARQRENQRILL